MRAIAEAIGMQGRYPEAEESLKQHHDASKMALGMENPETVESLQCLAILLDE
jgi:hypothetical protein